MIDPISIPGSLEDILSWEARALAHLATIGPDGAPQTSPVWFHWEDGLIEVSVYETSQKLKNMQRDPRVALSVVDPKDAYRYLEFRGVVKRLEPDPETELIIRLSGKYLGLDYYPWHEEGLVQIAVLIEPTRVFGMGG